MTEALRFGVPFRRPERGIALKARRRRQIADVERCLREPVVSTNFFRKDRLRRLGMRGPRAPGRARARAGRSDEQCVSMSSSPPGGGAPGIDVQYGAVTGEGLDTQCPRW